MAAIEISGLHKSFGSRKALTGLNLRVAPGEVAGFLGPNGAGKSTTIRILLGLLRADAGTVRLLGGDPWSDAVPLHRRLAYVPGDVVLWPQLTGGECLDFLARLRGGLVPTRRAELLDRFDLDPTVKARAYSKGNRQKVALVAALASDADVLILDEPTSGLDPVMEAVFTDCIRQEREAGRAVLLSSHILAEVEKLCDTVTIVRAGQDVRSGTLAQLRHLTRSTLTATTVRDPGALHRMEAVHALSIQPAADGWHVQCDVDDTMTGPVVRVLTDLGMHGLRVAPPSLEDLFLRHYGAPADHADGGDK